MRSSRPSHQERPLICGQPPGERPTAAAGTHRYVWVDVWEQPPSGEAVGQAHTGIVVTREGDVIFGHPTTADLVVFAEADPIRLIPVADASELHCLTLIEDDGEELLWIADSGTKYYGGGRLLEPRRGFRGGQVFQVDLEGNRRRELRPPPLYGGSPAPYSPTSVVVDEKRFGGSGDIWVADGYGASLVHRYDVTGRYLERLTGAEGAGDFEEPHGLLIDRRKSEPALYVADRRNHRIQVFDLEGRFKRHFGGDFLVAPSHMVASGESVVITDLGARRLTVIDLGDQLVCHLFENQPPPRGGCGPRAWPNAYSADGILVRPDLEAGLFNSPHGVGVDRADNIYVTEYVLGGRVVQLARV